MALALLASAILLTDPVMPALWLLVIVVALNGLSTSSVDVGGNILLIRVHGEKVSPFMNGLHFFFGLGALISPLIVAAVISRTTSINSAYWLITLFILGCILDE
jgi:FHS family Na+ dependent glucose MFS transporter 1